MKYYSLLLHRWLALIFALPLVVIIGSGLVLSIEPVLQQVKPKQPIDLPLIEGVLKRHDPQGQARSLTIRTYDNTLTLGGVGTEGSIVVDLGTGAEVRAPQRLAQFLLMARRLHETLLYDLGWLVTAATIVMVAIPCLGLLLGRPRWRNTLACWHQSAAWTALPLVILSPLSGIALAFGITFTAPAARIEPGRVTMLEAVRLVAAEHDLSNLVSIRQRGRLLMARIFVDGELRGFRIGSAQLQALPRNWPRVVHEGNWGGVWGPLMNLLTSAVLIGLLVTGLAMWMNRRRRRLRVRTIRMHAARAEW
jgi:uncharacterized iron-regulated membrane protein